jgi:hypothetical protein
MQQCPYCTRRFRTIKDLVAHWWKLGNPKVTGYQELTPDEHVHGADYMDNDALKNGRYFFYASEINPRAACFCGARYLGREEELQPWLVDHLTQQGGVLLHYAVHQLTGGYTHD